MADEHDEVLEILNEIREKVADYAKNLLKDSERSGSTPTKEGYISVLAQYLRQILMVQETQLSETDKNIIINSADNFVKTALANAYDVSLKSSRREVDGNLPDSVSDEFVKDNEKRLIDIKTKLQNEMHQLMVDSIKTGNTPSKAQALNHIKVRMQELITDYGQDLDYQSFSYLTNYATAWVDTTCETIYDTSLNMNPRQVNNKFPWTPADSIETVVEKATNPPQTEQKKYLSKYQHTNQSFSGSDMVCTVDMILPDDTRMIKVIGSLQTLTYSIYQEKRPVRAIGNMNAKDYVFGQRTIAGTLIFAVFNKHWAYEIMDEYKKAGQLGSVHFLMDELPPFQITIAAANEYGFTARLALYGVRIVNEGQVMSVGDVYTENTYQFVATDLDYLTDCTGYKKPKAVQITALPSTGITEAPPKPPEAPVQTQEESSANEQSEEQSEEQSDSESESQTETSDDPQKPEEAPVTDKHPYEGKTEQEVLDEIEKERKEAMKKIDEKAAAGEYKHPGEANTVRTVINAAINSKIEAAKKYFDEQKKE